MFFFGARKLEILYSKEYYVVNCLLVIMMEAFSMKLLNVIPWYAHGLITVAFLLVSLPLILNKSPTIEDFNRGYVVTVVLLMVNVSVAVFSFDKEYFLTIPFIVGVVLGNVNFLFRSRTISYAMFPFMLLPLIKISIYHRDVEHMAVFASISALCVISSILMSTNKAMVEKETERKAEFVKEVFKLTSGLSNHDLRNELASMMSLSSKKYRENLPLFLEAFDAHVNNILSHVSFNVFDHTDVDISDVISRMNHVTRNSNCEFVFEAEDDLPVKGNYNVISSMIKNFISNSVEAAVRNNKIAKVSVAKYGNVVEIIDDCGGFDVSRIGIGTSSKTGFGHGVFLSTIVDPSVQKMFGFNVRILNVVDGTRIIITFDKEST